MFTGIGDDRRGDFLIVAELIDKDLPARQLKRAYFDIEPGIDFIDYAVDPPPQIPAHTGNQYPVQ